MGNVSTLLRRWLPASFLVLCALSLTAHATTRQAPTSQQAWEHRVHSLIANSVSYPSQSRHQGASGRVLVHLTLMRDGSIQSLELAESAGSRDLDNAVLSAIRRIRHFPPFPADMAGQDSQALAIPFQFTITGSSATPPKRPAPPSPTRPKISSSPIADEFAEFLKSLSTPQ